MRKKIENSRRLLISALAVAVLSGCGGSSNSNTAPFFSSESYNFSGDEDTVITGQVQATDNDGDSLNYTVASAASHGQFSIAANGNFTYTPNQDYYGNDQVTISASDGYLSASATINFAIANVNDAPVLLRTDITSAENGVMVGQIIVSDADNDTITYSVVQDTEYGLLDLDSQSGEFTYTPFDLTQIDDAFVVGFTDGHIEAPITAQIQLLPLFVTNADKLNYYYTSAFSHLKKAEDIVATINDGVAINELLSDLASGYLLSGFTDKADELLASIDALDTQAAAYRNAADTAIAINMPDLAFSYLQQAQQYFNQYIAEKGIENLAIADNRVLLSYLKRYLDWDRQDAATALSEVMRSNANQIVQPIYTNNYGHILTAYNELAGDLITEYLAQQTPQQLDNILTVLNHFALMAEQTGYQETRSVRRYQLRALQLTNVARHYESINQTDKAREYVAKALSAYSAVNYDPQYSYAAMEYAENTLSASASSRVSLSTLAGLFEVLYPAAENIALQLLLTQTDTESNEYIRAQREAARFSILTAIVAGDDIGSTITSAKAEYSGEISALYDAIARDSGNNVSVAAKLFQRGLNDAALAVLDEALVILQSNERYTEFSSASYMTGDRGCYGIASMYKQFGGDLTSVLPQCQQIVDQYFDANLGTAVTLQTVAAYRDLISTYGLLNDASVTEQQNLAITLLQSNIERFEDVDQKINYYMVNIADLASLGLYDAAANFFDLALALIDSRLEDSTLQSSELKTLADRLTTNVGNRYAAGVINSARPYVNYIRALRMAAATEDNYQQKLGTVYAKLQQRAVSINSLAKNYSVNEQQSLHSSLLNLNLSADLIAEAHAIVDDTNTAAAEKITYLKTIGTHHSLLDHFPATDVANVDSDADGKPNFFLLHKTAEEIAASGLVADTDSDGDGTADTDDKFPLDPTRS